MADKEERILITTRHKNEKLNMTFTDMYKEYTIQEAIERMAKAIFKRDSVLALDIGFENLIEQKQNVYRDFAEIALNALLEGKNDER